MAEGLHQALDNLKQGNLDFIVGNSPEELRDTLLSLHSQVNILNIYAFGSKHIAWIMSHNKIKRVPRIREPKGV